MMIVRGWAWAWRVVELEDLIDSWHGTLTRRLCNVVNDMDVVEEVNAWVPKIVLKIFFDMRQTSENRRLVPVSLG